MAEPSSVTALVLTRRVRTFGRLALAVLAGYRGEALALRAGNLTFITLTSLVPLAAVVLSLLHGFHAGWAEALVTRFFQDVLSPGGRVQAEALVHKFLEAAKSRTGSGFSFAVLLVSAGVLLRHLDASLNEVWAVRRSRPLLASIASYIGVLLAGPVLMSAALLGTDSARRLLMWVNFPFVHTALAAGAVVSAIAVFAGLYKIAPHAHVPWRSALAGAVVAGVTWEVARRLYGSIASFFFSANPVYGSLGVAPLFLMWVYVSWYLILSGARLAYAVEHVDFHHEFRGLEAHPRRAELLGTYVAAHVASAERAGSARPTVQYLAAALRMPRQRVADVVMELEAAGLVSSRPDGIAPAKALDELSLADVSRAVGALLANDDADASGFGPVMGLFGPADAASAEKLKTISWVHLAELQSGHGQKP